MTGEDVMPFGKYGPKGSNSKLKDVPRTYFDWLLQQEGFTEKNKELAAWIKGGDSATATPKEAENLNIGKELLDNQSQAFRDWWKGAYGERLRKSGEMLYVPHLRVAIAAWQACEESLQPQNPPEF